MMLQSLRSRKGATVFGAATTIATIGVMSSLAIPSYISYADRAEAAERFTVTDGLCKDVVGEELAPFVTVPYMDATATFDLETPAADSPLAKIGRWRERAKIQSKAWKKGRYWIINAAEGTLCVGAYDADGDGGYALFYDGGSLTCPGGGTPVASTLDIGVTDKELAAKLDKLKLVEEHSPCTIRQDLYNLVGSVDLDGRSPF